MCVLGEGWKIYIKCTKGVGGLLEMCKSIRGGRRVKNSQIWVYVPFEWPLTKKSSFEAYNKGGRLASNLLD